MYWFWFGVIIMHLRKLDNGHLVKAANGHLANECTGGGLPCSQCVDCWTCSYTLESITGGVAGEIDCSDHGSSFPLSVVKVSLYSCRYYVEWQADDGGYRQLEIECFTEQGWQITYIQWPGSIGGIPVAVGESSFLCDDGCLQAGTYDVPLLAGGGGDPLCTGTFSVEIS